MSEVEVLHLAAFVENVQVDDEVVDRIGFERLEKRLGKITREVLHFQQMTVTRFQLEE